MYILFVFNKEKYGFVGENDVLVASARRQHKFKNMNNNAIRECQGRFIRAGYDVNILQNPDEKMARDLLNRNKRAYQAIQKVAKYTKRHIVPNAQSDGYDSSLEFIILDPQKMNCAYISVIDDGIYAIEDIPTLQQGDRLDIFDEHGRVSNEVVKLFQSI